jgi:hypothetical protein
MAELPHQSYAMLDSREFVAAYGIWLPAGDPARLLEQVARYRMALQAIARVTKGAYDDSAVTARDIAEVALDG